MADPRWAAVTAALAATLCEAWRVGATALWAANRRREAAWLRAEYHAAAGVLAAAGVGGSATIRAAVRRCRAEARRSAEHPLLAAPWREAARALVVAARIDQLHQAGVRRQVPPPYPSRRAATAGTQVRT